ncbi:hypothetical protein ASPZODRAFT_140583 [Penicilliopsis zonata CBS 506.65]|uniref:Expansin-like EG45 domain-containing protein n=1 Tax=Penicilliopsis zonata CBS 506.65 TaxID=1073090 RepID=A0A1L9SM27_9EURO|nr:hypothetical protein ASPZODRAFT_140583 [Penicilliopsis zonata CBS 506.65]OJJ48275.1 hypothetical protein ASPZODRAFT_140583 [Penicilliopsis zonata CBS 506.65]
MKFQSLASLGVAALGAASTAAASGLLDAREDAGQCPSGYSMSVYYLTVTATPSPTEQSSSTALPSPTGQCPVGYTPSVYYITVTATPSSTVEEQAISTASIPTEQSSAVILASTVEPTTTILSTSTTTVVVTVLPTPGSSSDVAAASAADTTSAAVEAATTEAAATSVSTGAETTPDAAAAAAAAAADTTSTAAVAATQQAETVSSAEAETTTAAAAVASSSTSTTTETQAATSSTSASTAASTGTTYDGEATYYGGNVAGGTCSFSGYTLPSGIYGTALTSSSWDDAANCGACITVTGPSGNSIKAMIVDECPGCGTNHLDLFEDAFAELADISTGVIDVEWSYVACGIDTPIQLKNKDGTSEYWFAMQVVNANEPVASLEVSTDGGSTWQSTTRATYNYFENESGFDTDTVDVRVTSTTGSVITVSDVSVASDSTTTASSNFS